jgi:hypothetical protein
MLYEPWDLTIGWRMMMRPRICTQLLLVSVVWSLTACGSAPAVPTEESIPAEEMPPIASATPEPEPTATPTGPVGDGFRLFTDEPVLAMGAPGTWDSGLMDPGAVVYHEGQFHMFYDGVPSFPALLGIGYAVSEDGLTFSRISADPVFTLDDVPWDPKPGNIRANSVLVEEGTWVLYFTASEGLGSLVGVVGRATAASPTGPWTVDGERVLEPGDAKAWDSGAIGHVEVVRSGEGYVMYYSAGLGIGMATSADGIRWEKYDDPTTDREVYAASDPVMAKPGAEDPNVQPTVWGWAMAYRYRFSLHYAESTDGLHWTDAPVNPIVTFLDRGIYFSSLSVRDGAAFLYFEAGDPSATSVYVATWRLTAPKEDS